MARTVTPAHQYGPVEEKVVDRTRRRKEACTVCGAGRYQVEEYQMHDYREGRDNREIWHRYYRATPAHTWDYGEKPCTGGE